MKSLKFSLFAVLMMFFAIVIQAQESCKVLVPELDGTYVGKCKKGFAHGKGKAVGTDTYEGNFKKGLPNGGGVYTWANGDVYDGRWVFGVRDGEGNYKFKYDGEDSIQEGIWKDGVYAGPKPRNPYVISKRNITKYSFRRKSDGNEINVRLFMDGSNNNDIEDYTIVGGSGTTFSCGTVDCLENVNYPVIVKVSYVTWNKAHTVLLNAALEFEIFEEGNWEVLIYN